MTIRALSIKAGPLVRDRFWDSHNHSILLSQDQKDNAQDEILQMELEKINETVNMRVSQEELEKLERKFRVFLLILT